MSRAIEKEQPMTEAEAVKLAEKMVVFVPSEIAGGNGSVAISNPIDESGMKVWELHTLRGDRGLAERCVNDLRKWISFILLAASRPGEGMIRTNEGKDLRVLGTLPVTADGCVCGAHPEVSAGYVAERVWSVHPKDGEIIECDAVPWWSDLDDWRVSATGADDKGDRRCFPVSWCYSTIATAEAASAAKGVGDGE